MLEQFKERGDDVEGENKRWRPRFGGVTRDPSCSVGEENEQKSERSYLELKHNSEGIPSWGQEERSSWRARVLKRREGGERVEIWVRFLGLLWVPINPILLNFEWNLLNMVFGFRVTRSTSLVKISGMIKGSRRRYEQWKSTATKEEATLLVSVCMLVRVTTRFKWTSPNRFA